MLENEVIARDDERQRIASEVDAFLRNGGKLTILPQHAVSSHAGSFGYNNKPRGSEDGK